MNLILAVAATLSAVGAALVLWLLSRTVEAYFAWQVVVSGEAIEQKQWKEADVQILRAASIIENEATLIESASNDIENATKSQSGN